MRRIIFIGQSGDEAVYYNTRTKEALVANKSALLNTEGARKTNKAIIPFYNYKKEVGKVKLERTSQWSRKQFKIIILFLLLSVLMSCFYLFWGVLTMLMMTVCINLLYIILMGNLSYSEGCQYTIERGERK